MACSRAISASARRSPTRSARRAGAGWPRLELPVDERLTLDGCLRQVDFLDGEVAALDREIAKQALAWPEVLRLMTRARASTCRPRRRSWPRSATSAASPRRASSSATSASIRACANRATRRARHGRISKAGASEARHMLGEVAWKVTLTPGPLRAFFERVRARRGTQIAATATARKLVVLFWHLLTREQDYAFARPAMTRNKIRQLELLAGAPPQKGRKGIAGGKSKAVFDAERELSRQAEAAYRRLVSDWQRQRPTESGCGRDTGARISKALEGQSRAAGSLSPNDLRFASSVTRTHHHSRKGDRQRVQAT